MIILSASLGREKTEALISSLRRLGIPAAAVSPSKLAEYTGARLIVTSASNPDRLRDEAFAAGKTRVIAFTESDAEECEGVPLYRWQNASRAAQTAADAVGYDVSVSLGLLTVSSDKATYHKTELPLTFTERLILTCLIEKPGEYVGARELALLCTSGRSESAVNTHVSSINKKALPLLGHRLILTKRFSGYKINE